ncbi:MAG: protein translocase subunit SecF [Anaerolineae bacterium]
MQKRRYFFLFSGAIIIPGLIIMLYSLVTTGSLFHLSNEFLGGSIYELRYTAPGATEQNIRDVFIQFGDPDVGIQQVGGADSYRWSVRGKYQVTEVSDQIVSGLAALAPLDRDALRVDQVSGTVGAEVERAALLAVLIATGVVTGFIVLAFRTVPDAFRYGACAILAMIHDVLVLSAAMSLAGLLLKWEVNALFLTAVLTVVGFSIQDTIVLFDRIRENIPKYLGESYETIVNRSILETIHRSLAMQICVFFVTLSIMLFGGESIRQFMAMLFVGLLTGTYSSIFIAVPLLVSWEKGELPLVNRPAKTAEA